MQNKVQYCQRLKKFGWVLASVAAVAIIDVLCIKK